MPEEGTTRAPEGATGEPDRTTREPEGATRAPDRTPRRIVLVGFMAAGKSTVGPRLARRLDRPFVDLDARVERMAGRSIPGIFREGGEAAFRALEARASRELDGMPAFVLATGGGWMARPELRDRWEHAVRIWLQVRPSTVLLRLAADPAPRPMLDPENPEGSVRRLLEARAADYARAELRVPTDDLDPDEVTDRILEALASGFRRTERGRADPTRVPGVGEERNRRGGGQGTGRSGRVDAEGEGDRAGGEGDGDREAWIEEGS